MIFASRRDRGPDRYLHWKVKSFFVGAILALAGIGIESSALVAVAIFVLLAGMVLRFLPGGEGESADDGGGEGEEDEEGDETVEGEDDGTTASNPTEPPH
jgi:hypothetical protein